MKDGVAVSITGFVVAAAGFGLAKIFDGLSFVESNIWPLVLMFLISIISYFVYMIQVDGFALRKAKNDQRVADFRQNVRTIEAAKQIKQ